MTLRTRCILRLARYRCEVAAERLMLGRWTPEVEVPVDVTPELAAFRAYRGIDAMTQRVYLLCEAIGDTEGMRAAALASRWAVECHASANRYRANMGERMTAYATLRRMAGEWNVNLGTYCV